MIGPEEILAKVEIAKQSANLCGSGLDQRVILACLKRGLIEAQKERIRPYYRAKRDAMLDALGAGDAGGRALDAAGRRPLRVADPARGHGRRGRCSRRAVAEGVAYVTGAPFHVDGGGANTMRLTFAKEDAPTIAEGVKRLARAVQRCDGGRVR